MSKGFSVSKFYKSFSGTDTIAFLMFPGINPIVIGSLTTVSYSMYRNKVPVINIGRTNINGITRGSRIYAGTMVFTLINKHWLRELQEHASYLKDFPTLKTDELPLFDIMIVSANEYGSACTMFIYGVDFTDEAQTISVEDLFTENIFKFVAREVAVFDELIIKSSDIKKKYYTVKTGTITNYFTDEQTRQTLSYERSIKNIRGLDRTLYLVTNGSPMIGTDVAAIQQLLNEALEYDVAVTYKYDRFTEKAVKDFQTTSNLNVNGIVDNEVYAKLLQYTKNGVEGTYAQIINKSGAYVYQYPDTSSSVTKILPYLSSVEIFDRVGDNFDIFYQTRDGYVSLYDVYNYLEINNDPYTFEQLKYQDSGPQVTILQNALESLFEGFDNYQTGLYDEITENYIKKFQRENGLLETGICDSYTWEVLLNQSKDDNYRYYITNHAEINPSKEPGIYTITDIDQLSNYTVSVTNNNTQQVKYSAIAVYEDGSTKTNSKVLTFDGTETHSINEFKNMFNDDVKHLSPTDVYYTIYPYGSTPYKWHFKVA